MQLFKTLSLGLLATVLWNCNGTTQSEGTATTNAKVAASVNALSKRAALSVGMVPAAQAPDPKSPFDAEVLTAFKDAGLCQGFIDLFAEIVANEDAAAAAVSPRLQEVGKCFAEKIQEQTPIVTAQTMNADTTEIDIGSIVSDCFCNGSGSLFSGFSFKVAFYAPPTLGISYAVPVITGTPYAPPTTTVAPYAAPGSPGGEGYGAPGL